MEFDVRLNDSYSPERRAKAAKLDLAFAEAIKRCGCRGGRPLVRVERHARKVLLELEER